jgi:hypothetical protein
MAACLLVTLPLELVLKAAMYRRPRRWLAAGEVRSFLRSVTWAGRGRGGGAL